MPDVTGARVKHEHVITGQVQVQQANQAVAGSFDQVKSGIDVFSASAVVAANQALELAGKFTGLASSVAEAAEAGAAAADINRSFQALGDAAPGIEALRASVAGVVDDTTLERYAVLNAEMELSAETATAFASRITVLAEEQGRLSEVSDLLARAQRSPLEVMKELGVIIDANSSQYGGLSEAQRNLMVIQEQARKVTKAQIDSMDSASAAILQQKATWDNLVSSVEQGIAAWLQSSGALDAVGEAIEGVQSFLEENAELFESLGRIAMQVADIVGNLLVRAFNVLETTLDLLLPVVEGVLTGLQAVSEFISLDFGESIEEVFITDIPFATSNMEGLNTTIANFRDELRLAREEAEKGRIVTEEQVDLVQQAFAVEEQVSALYKENVGDFEDAGRALVANLGSREAALEVLSQQREVLENAADLIDEQTDKERAFGAVALKNRIEGQEGAVSRLAILEEITAQILTQNALELQAIEAAKEAEKRKEEARRKSKAAREEAKRDLLAFDELLTELMIDEESSAAAALIAEDAAKAHMFRLGFGLGTELRAGFDAFFEEEEELPPIFQGIEATAAATENLAERNAILAGSFSAVASSMSELDFASDSFLGKAGQVSDSMSMMVKGLDQAGDSTASAVAAVAGASAEMAGSVFESTTAQAALLALFYGAQGWALLPNVAAATPKFVASATMATAAAMSFAGVGGKSSSGGSAGAGAGAGVAPDAAGFGPSLATDTNTGAQQGPGTSVYVQYVSPNGREGIGPMLSMVNELGRSGAGFVIDAELIEGMGG
jgi:hypothetical protein